MLASDTLGTIFARDRVYQKQTFSLNYKKKNKLFCPFFSIVKFHVTFFFFYFFQIISLNKCAIFSVIIIMYNHISQFFFYCGIIFFCSSISFFVFHLPHLCFFFFSFFLSFFLALGVVFLCIFTFS